MTQNEPTLPANRAFVVQFRSDADMTQQRVDGRVEHFVSGQAAHFDSWKGLRAFIERTLQRVSEETA